MTTYRVTISADIESDDGTARSANALYLALSKVCEDYGADENDYHGEEVQDITNP